MPESGEGVYSGVFRYYFQMKLSQDWYSCSTRLKLPELMVRFWDLIKGWKGKFFSVKSEDLGKWAVGMRWRESVKITDHIPAATEYNEGSVGRISSLMLDVRELQEPLLYVAALSPMPIERAGT